jgi:hypothetical protein
MIAIISSVSSVAYVVSFFKGVFFGFLVVRLVKNSIYRHYGIAFYRTDASMIGEGEPVNMQPAIQESFFKLPQKKRTRNAPEYELTDLDINLLETVYRYSVLLPRQIESLIPLPNMQDIVDRLYQCAYLERIPRPTYSHLEAKEPAYRLGVEGARLLAKLTETPLNAFYYWGRGDDKDKRRTEVSIFFLEHELENADVRIALEQSAAQTGCTWEVWHDGFYLRRLRNWAKVAVETFPGHHETISVIPDDYGVLLGWHGRGHFIIEHDRSNETTKRWKRKILAYKAFVLSGEFHTRYNIKGSETPLRILTTTPSLERAYNLKAIAETCGPSEATRLFLFAPFGEVVSQNALTAPIWLRAGSSNHEAIL